MRRREFITTVSVVGGTLASIPLLIPAAVAKTPTPISQSVAVSGRLLTHYIRHEMSTLLTQYMFEFNDNTTRQSITKNIIKILDHIRNSEVIDEYMVICDETNNPSTIIDKNRLQVHVYIKYMGTTDVVIINGVLSNDGVTSKRLA